MIFSTSQKFKFLEMLSTTRKLQLQKGVPNKWVYERCTYNNCSEEKEERSSNESHVEVLTLGVQTTISGQEVRDL